MKTSTHFANRFFVFDVESIGLHGQAFAVAGGITAENGELSHQFCYACDPSRAAGDKADREWVADNCKQIQYNCGTPLDVVTAFWAEWEGAKTMHPEITMAAECAWPVETSFLHECMNVLDLSARKMGPYPLHEIASFMAAAGMDPMATYDRLPDEMPKHHPLADARQSARLLWLALARIAEK